MRRGAGRGCGQARQTAPTETTSRLGPRRCPGNARPCVVRGHQEIGRRGPLTPRHSKTPREPGPGGARRGLDSWRRAPTRLERLSASGLLPPARPEGVRRGAGVWGRRLAGSRARQRYVPGTPLGSRGLRRAARVRARRAAGDLRRRWPPRAGANFVRGGRGRGWGPGTRYLGTGAQSAPAGARAAAPGPGAAWSSARGGRGAGLLLSRARPGPRLPGGSPRRLRSGAGHGSPPGRRSSPDAGGRRWRRFLRSPLRALRG